METTKTRRLNVNLPENVYEELQKLSRETGRSMTDLVRTAFGLVQVAYDETGRKKNNKLVVADEDGEPIKEILIPK